MEQQFDAVWLSGAGVHADGTPWIARKSGIYEGTKAAFLAGGKLAACCPTRDEITTVDWGGGAGIYQPLSTGDYAFYQNGHCRIYDNRNHVIWGWQDSAQRSLSSASRSANRDSMLGFPMHA